MTKQDFIKKLEALAKSSKPPAELADLSEGSQAYIQLSNQLIEDDRLLIDQVITLLDDSEEFHTLANCMIARSPSLLTGSRMAMFSLSMWLLAQTRLNDAAAAYENLLRHTKESCKSEYYIALSGVKADQSFLAHDDIEIILPEEMPDSVAKERILQKNKRKRHEVFFKTDAYDYISCILAIKNCRHTVFIPEKLAKGDLSDVKAWKDLNDKVKTANEIIRILPIVAEHPVNKVCEWLQTDVSTPIVGGSVSCVGVKQEHRNAVKTPNIDIAECKKLLDAYFAWPETERKKLTLSLEQINVAMNALGIRDQSIALGIAIESLLTKSGEKNELTYKMSLRGTKLLGGNSEEKTYTFDMIRKLYGLRSMAIHGDEVRNKKISHPGKFLRESQALVVRLIKTIIEQGEIPDFDKLVID